MYDTKTHNKKDFFKRYGLFIGRCQPFTNAHNEIVQEIIRDGRKPIIMLGSINKEDEKNPLRFGERADLIRRIYSHNVTIMGTEDKDSWNEWFSKVLYKLESIHVHPKDIVLYSHTKESDNTNFVYNSKLYTNKPYTIMFEEYGFEIKNLAEIRCSLGETIHASDIRKCENIAKRNLDARIYRHLKDTHKWWN